MVAVSRLGGRSRYGGRHELVKLDPPELDAAVQPTTSRSAGVDLEILPQFTTLDTTRLRMELGLATPSAELSLADCFASL